VAAGNVMTGHVALLADEYIQLRRGLGYRSPSQERALRAFARYMDREGHDGPIPLESSLDWATSTASTDPCNPARRLMTVRGFLRHLAALDDATEVPASGLLGPTGHRTPPHVYSDQEIADLLQATAGLAPAGGLRPRCYATLFGLLACTGMRICEALALACGDVDLAGGMLTVRAGKRGRTRLVPLHPSALAPLRDYAAEREQRCGPPGDGAAFFRTTAATASATRPQTTRSPCCVGGWAGPRPVAPGRRACTTCGTGWWCAVSRPGTPMTSTSTARSLYWRPTSATWRCVTSTGTCPPSRS
jgi:integrase